MIPYSRLPVLSKDFGRHRPSPPVMPDRPFLRPALEALYCDPAVARRVGAAIRLEFLRLSGVPLGESWRSVAGAVLALVRRPIACSATCGALASGRRWSPDVWECPEYDSCRGNENRAAELLSAAGWSL